MIGAGTAKTPVSAVIWPHNYTAESPRDLAEAGAVLTTSTESPEGGAVAMMQPPQTDKTRTPRRPASVRLAEGSRLDESGCDAVGQVQSAAWVVEHGTWPAADMVLDHACNTKACVNVAHLRELTNSQNLRRAIPRGDEATERQRARWRLVNARRRGTYRYAEGG